MRKLKLGVKGVQDILTREELRKITGGIGSGSEGSYPGCEGLGDREVCCADNGALGTCNQLHKNGCSLVVDKDSERCPKGSGSGN